MTNMQIIRTENKKRATLTLCIMTYIMAYLCRLNFSSAVLKISEAMEVTTTTMGVVGSLFFISYALGQLINGFIGDRVSSIRFIIIAILGTGGINLLMTFADNIWVIKLLWVMNGYFQSVFWSSCNRLLSYYYAKNEHHIISTGMSLSMVMSYILSWAILGKLLINSTWQSYFFIPAIVAGIMLISWFIFAKLEKQAYNSATKTTALNYPEFITMIKEEHLYLICLTCIFTGLVKEGIGLWAPVIFLIILGGNINQSLLLILFIPLGNFFGIILAEKLLKRKNSNAYGILKIMLLTMAICSLLILIVKDLLPTAAIFLISMIAATALGSNSILLSYIPLSYSSKNIVSTLIGLFNFSAYVGAAISAFVLGIFLNEGNWQIIPIVWISAAILGLSLVSILNKLSQKAK